MRRHGAGAGAYASASRAYTESAILTADGPQLVLLLYQGAVRFVGRAIAELDAGRPDRMWIAVGRAQAILDELNGSLDMSHGELPERLRSIYLFCKRRLVEGGTRRDAAALADVSRLLADLGESWEGLAAPAPAPAPAV
jgi:flagellar protein FliS